MRTNKRTMALALVGKLDKVAAGSIMEWRPVHLIVHRHDHLEALQYAVEKHWIEASPSRDSVRLTAQGRGILRTSDEQIAQGRRARGSRLIRLAG